MSSPQEKGMDGSILVLVCNSCHPESPISTHTISQILGKLSLGVAVWSDSGLKWQPLDSIKYSCSKTIVSQTCLQLHCLSKEVLST